MEPEQKILRLYLDRGLAVADHPDCVQLVHEGWRIVDAYGIWDDHGELVFIVKLRRAPAADASPDH